MGVDEMKRCIQDLMPSFEFDEFCRGRTLLRDVVNEIGAYKYAL